MNDINKETSKRRTFAIISHPDAGKTTLTEKLLLFGGAINQAGTVKARKSARHATSDWMAMEKERGISVTSTVMQFPYKKNTINLLDTPGHADFSEDTYRTLTAVDSALMVIDSAKGVEERTLKLMEVCRLRQTPIFTFINKLDREGRDPLELIDEIENVLKIHCTPITWPLGMGKEFKGVYHLLNDEIHIYHPEKSGKIGESQVIKGLQSNEAKELLDDQWESFFEQIELIKGASDDFSIDDYLAGAQTPVFFGSAINSFGITLLLDYFAQYAPEPQSRSTNIRQITPNENKLTGFIFKVQANMDPAHRDRIAFMRICSGKFTSGDKLHQVRTGKAIKTSNAMAFLANEREKVEYAYPGDIVGLHNHGTIRIGDTFTQGEKLHFEGIPSFAPELFRRAQLKDPLKLKQLQKGLTQLSEEGATQFFKPLINNDLILGAIGILQFDVVAYRLQYEYGVNAIFEGVNIKTVRWVSCDDEKTLKEFIAKHQVNLGYDSYQQLVYLAPSLVNLQLAEERWPQLTFQAVKELTNA